MLAIQWTGFSVSLQMSSVKPLSGNWFTNAFDYVSSHPEIIIN